jgi:membrane protein implicated in regulation of membrane protease activity
VELAISPLSPLWLISIGFLLIGAEILLYSFYILWFGISAIVVGVASNFFQFENIYQQIFAVSIIALLLLFFLKRKVVEVITEPREELEEERPKIGKIVGNRVSFDGTIWSYTSEDQFSDGDSVQIVSKRGNSLEIKKV